MTQNHDPLDLRGQERTRARRTELERLAKQAELDDIKWLMSSKRGRRIVWRLLEQTGVFKSSFTGNSETFFREGMRNVGLTLMGQIHEACPEQYTSMVQEQREHAKRNPDDNGTT